MSDPARDRPSVPREFDEFMADPRASVRGDVRFPGFRHMYVRKSMRALPGVGEVRCIDLASLRARRPGRGAFTTLVAHLRGRYPEFTIYTESVTNERFCARLARMGFTHIEMNPPCYFLSPGDAGHGPE